MFYSPRYKLLFVAIPKTGTRSIHDFLHKIDPGGYRRKLVLDNGREITIDQIGGRVVGHATARDLKNAIGAEEWDKLNVFAFVREPKQKLASAYAYNRGLSMGKLLAIGKRFRLVSYKTIASALLAKLLPFAAYILVYTMKTNREYCCDQAGELLIPNIGRTEYLEEDFKMLLERMGVNVECELKLGHLNKSKSSGYAQKIDGVFSSKVFNLKYRKELDFYRSLFD